MPPWIWVFGRGVGTCARVPQSLTFKVKPLLERQLQAFDRGKEVKGSVYAIARLNGVYFVVAAVWLMMEEG